MRQICPHCEAAIEVPADAAGKDFECTACRRYFPVAKGYTPTVDPSAVRPIPPLSAVIPPPATATMPPAPPPGFVAPKPAAASTDAFEKDCGISLKPALTEWMPVIALSLVLILTVFAWVVIAPDGIRAYSQSPWGSFVGTLTPDPLAEPVMEAEMPLKNKLSATWLWLTPYLVGLVAWVIFAWVERLFESSKRVAMPSPLVWIEPLWPYRYTALSVGAGLLLLLIVIQSAKGFGLESAATAVRAEMAANLSGMKEKVEAADTSVKKHRIEIEAAKATAYLTTEGTTVRCLAIWLHVFAFAGVLGRVWVMRRGNKPLPRLELKW